MSRSTITLFLENLIKCGQYTVNKYLVIPANPASGILYITQNSPDFISGHVRMRGREEGKYPYYYLEMIDRIFGPSENTIEVCSHSKFIDAVTVDINPKTYADFIDNGQILAKIKDNSFQRWRCDPPYSEKRAKGMYNTELPNSYKLLEAGTRVCKSGSLLFLLLGPQNYQRCPPGIKRIGWVAITIVPNNELRTLHIYYKG